MGSIEWPKPTGPHEVGTTSFLLVDPMRCEAYAPSPKLGRRVTVDAWYPATPGTGTGLRPYFTDAEARCLPFGIHSIWGWAPDAALPLCEVITNSWVDATIASNAGERLPLLVFSHGGQSHARQNTALMEDLASWGYVVLSLGHPYESGGVVLPDGEAITMSPEMLDVLPRIVGDPDFVSAMGGGSYLERLGAWRKKIRVGRRSQWLGFWANLWAEDTVFVLDAIELGALPSAGQFLADVVDTSKVGFFGMSYGGAVTTRLCALDDRAAAGVNIDGACWTWDAVDADVATPFLVMHSDPVVQFGPALEAMGLPLGDELKTLTPNTPLHSDLDLERHVALGLRDDVLRITLPGLTHTGMMDQLIIAPEAHRAGMGSGPLAGRRGVALQNRLCREFFDTHVRGLDREFPSKVLAENHEIVRRDLSILQHEARSAAADL